MAKVLEGPGMGLMKKWGISVPQYVVVSSVDELKKLADGNNWLSKATLVVKAHEALGSRFKLGLVKVDLDLRGAQAAAKEMLGRQVGSIMVTQVIVSEMFPHEEEYYAAVKSTRDGADVLIASCGGIEVESNWDRVKKLSVEVGSAPSPENLQKLAKEAGFSGSTAEKIAEFAGKLFACFDNEDAQYLEVNPVVARRGKLANYAEYSGDPPDWAVEVLTEKVCSLPGIKNIIVGGAIANFTDVKKTFGGIIAGFRKAQVEGKLNGVKIWVRRGGPREKEGLDAMRALRNEGFDIHVFDRHTPLTDIVDKALQAH